MSSALHGLHAVIVGGSSGMGPAAARCVAEAGGRVTIAGRRADRLERAREALGGERIAVPPLDMTDEPAVCVFAGRFERASVDALVVSASSVAHGAFAERRRARSAP